MQPESYAVWRNFYDEGSAKEMQAMLQSGGIESYIDDDEGQFDPFFRYEAKLGLYRLKLKSEDFDRAEALIQGMAISLMDQVPKDHYLFSFSREELLEVVAEPDQWCQLDYQLAQHLLNQQGLQNQVDALKETQDERRAELARPEAVTFQWWFVGYLMVFCGGIIAAFMGWSIQLNRKVLPDGERVYTYRPEDRRRARSMMVAGIISTIVWLFLSIWMTIKDANFSF